MGKITCFEDETVDLYDELIISREVIDKHIKIINVSKEDRTEFASGSKGMQVKWKLDDIFIKLDCSGFEAVAEIVACWMIGRIKNLKFDYVRYYPCIIVEDGIKLGKGCYSKIFLDDCEEVTIGKILNDNLKSFSIHYDDLRDLILDETDLDIKDYLDTILCIDALTRNEDRHFHNISLLLDTKYRFAPIFDNGAAFMSDTISFPFTVDFDTCYYQIQAKPFSIDFNAQIKNVNRLLIDDKELLDSIDDSGSREMKRIKKVLEYSLEDSKNIAWERY